MDEEDGIADVFVTNASNSVTFGPFASGSVVKITEAPGATPSSKPMGGPNSAVAAHIKLDSDAWARQRLEVLADEKDPRVLAARDAAVTLLEE